MDGIEPGRKIMQDLDGHLFWDWHLLIHHFLQLLTKRSKRTKFENTYRSFFSLVYSNSLDNVRVVELAEEGVLK